MPVPAAGGGWGKMRLVPVPDALRTLSHDPAFWADYFFRTHRSTPDADPDPAELRATFPVAGGYALVLDLDREYGTYALGLRTPGSSEPIPMAWDDRSRWHPHGLLWPELDLIGRVVALDDPSLPHPGLPVALLCRFTPITPEDDAAAVQALLGAALRSLRVPVPPAEQEPLFRYTPRVLSEEQVADYLEVPGEGVAGTLRYAGSDVFPFDDLAELVRLAQRRVGRVAAEPWRTERVRALARQRDIAGLLAALEAGGCDHPTLLDALSDPVTPAEAGWVLDMLGGDIPVPLRSDGIDQKRG
ncbi:hypothetical protein RB614_21270 [Phytohabitans sp. ZYX-F-186]|uniref:Uncharacterized protein n=1 Tax=Phytohabitans maris TaxID=3071409 RepID=A0ABU0ZJ13_9ACTN|nr:hypothetical protein [Phytohabitans sp. ZYX-F-186]MDQ7907046.1 hypothetical protein [Phytohabitans sp. ZYX-F-186]